jgi:hypothetical protein
MTAIRETSPEFICLDCQTDTLFGGEYYMVHDNIWNNVAGDGMLCIGCLEVRLDRQLTKADFADCPLHTDRRFPQSPRLSGRLH